MTNPTKWVLPGLLAAGLVGCGGGATRPVPSSESGPDAKVTAATTGPSRHAGTEVTCGDIIVETDGVEGRRVVLDVVAIHAGYIPGSRPLATPSDRSDFAFFVKDGMQVRGTGREEVVFEVPQAWRDRIGIGWGNPARPSAVVRVARCNSTARWVGYSGGFFVNGPVCAPIAVHVNQRTTLVHVGIATECA